MFCKNCGNQIADDSKFCNNCGQRIINEETQNSNEVKSIKHGNIQKCPNCGEVVDSFSLKCSACGYEFRNVESSNSILSLSEALNDIDENIESQGTFDKLFNQGKIDRSTNKKIELIKNFSIPNAKEDILEFMIMATANIDLDILANNTSGMNLTDFNSKKALSNAWISKMQQAYHKASLTLKDDPIFTQIKTMYEMKKNEINKAKLKVVLTPVLLLVGVIVLYVAYFGYLGRNDTTKKLEKLYSEIQVDINEGRYDEALIKANELRFDRGYSNTKADLWDEKRENIIKIINEKKEEK